MTVVEVGREPLTYDRHTPEPRSYFRDLALARKGDNAAETRLQRHAEEMRVEIPKREAEREARARAAGLEYRINPNRTDGTGGYFSAPAWLISEFATAARTSRVLSKLIPNIDLPRGVSSVNLPRLTTGTHTTPTQDGQAVASRDIVDAAATQPVMPIAGMSDVALQALEQSPVGAHLDWAIFKDLTASYDSQLELALINGSGVGAAFTGILNLTTGAGGVSAVTYTDASPTPAEILPFLAQAVAQHGDARLMPPETWLMRTARFAWIAGFDAATRPNNILPLLGFPHALDDAIPATLGATATQDAIIVMRPSDSILMESEPSTDVFLEPLSGTMQARLRLNGNACAIHRYPTGIATITGTGMAVVSGY